MPCRAALWVWVHHPHNVQAMSPACQQALKALPELVLRLQAHNYQQLLIVGCVGLQGFDTPVKQCPDGLSDISTCMQPKLAAS